MQVKELVRSKGASLNRRDHGSSSGGGGGGEVHVSWAGEEGIPQEESCSHPWAAEGPSSSNVKHQHLTEVKTESSP